MNLILPISYFQENGAPNGAPRESACPFFMEKRKNLIMDGHFTKLVFSNHLFTMTGLYVYFDLFTHALPPLPLTAKPPTDRNTFFPSVGYKQYIHFDPYTLDNRQTTESICELERWILSCYGAHLATKTPAYSLSTQLYGGVLKIHAEDSGCGGYAASVAPVDHESRTFSRYFLKISGVWETAYQYGITYKFGKTDPHTSGEGL